MCENPHNLRTNNCHFILLIFSGAGFRRVGRNDKLGKFGVRGKRSITGDTAIRLGKLFGIEPEFWMNLQSRYDLETAEDKFSSKVKIVVGRYKDLVGK
ncbi:MAG: HigA family addiction module antidote protein [Nitrospinae bacterium]|nr:HigA family addiction module antidote protein [Nitrospinota bacterium]